MRPKRFSTVVQDLQVSCCGGSYQPDDSSFLPDGVNIELVRRLANTEFWLTVGASKNCQVHGSHVLNTAMVSDIPDRLHRPCAKAWFEAGSPDCEVCANGAARVHVESSL